MKRRKEHVTRRADVYRHSVVSMAEHTDCATDDTEVRKQLLNAEMDLRSVWQWIQTGTHAAVPTAPRSFRTDHPVAAGKADRHEVPTTVDRRVTIIPKTERQRSRIGQILRDRARNRDQPRRVTVPGTARRTFRTDRITMQRRVPRCGCHCSHQYTDHQHLTATQHDPYIRRPRLSCPARNHGSLSSPSAGRQERLSVGRSWS